MQKKWVVQREHGFRPSMRVSQQRNRMQGEGFLFLKDNLFLHINGGEQAMVVAGILGDFT